jgi:3-deoxy-D-manno-octulosonate 8-phosphate phosphatase (KDO 8-P phosphatase)
VAAKEVMMELTPALRARAEKIALLVLDVDGVLTDGLLYYDAQGEAMKAFSVHDGTAIKWLQRAGVEVAILTGRESKPVLARARELGIKEVMMDAKHKLPVMMAFVNRTGYDPDTIAYMGDDLLDLPVLHRVGLALAPADAAPEVRAAAHFVASAPGGRGAVREACELILKAIGKWDEITRPYLSS